MKKKINYLSRIYERNPISGKYIVEISLDKYEDAFNDWDHANYKKRDLNPQPAFFLERCLDITGSFLIKNGTGNVFVNTLIQGATVGGWVFLWEALSIVFFKMEDGVTTRKIYEKLNGSEIYFKDIMPNAQSIQNI